MARTYVIKSGDTMGKIAKRFYGDAGVGRKLAFYNGIQDPNRILLGQSLEVPARRELNGGPAAVPAPPRASVAAPVPAGAPTTPAAAVPAAAPAEVLIPPNGLEEILTVFGDINEYIRDDGTIEPQWETDLLVRATLPFPIAYSGNPAQMVTRIYCHRKLRDIFPSVFAEIQRQGLAPEINTYGGCYNFRSKRTSGKFSTHCWGIAVDLDPQSNLQGAGAGSMHPGVVAIFRQSGFKWGGDWTGKTRDPMHFQYCTGY